MQFDIYAIQEHLLNSLSPYVPAQLTKDTFLLHHINSLTKKDTKFDKCYLPTFIACQSYTKVRINHTSYQIQVTTRLPFCLRI